MLSQLSYAPALCCTPLTTSDVLHCTLYPGICQGVQRTFFNFFRDTQDLAADIVKNLVHCKNASANDLGFPRHTRPGRMCAPRTALWHKPRRAGSTPESCPAPTTLPHRQSKAADRASAARFMLIRVRLRRHGCRRRHPSGRRRSRRPTGRRQSRRWGGCRRAGARQSRC